MLRENLKDAGEIIQNILTQPLSIPGTTESVSLLQAAENFSPKENIESCNLSKVMHAFIEYPEPTHVLLNELELILEEIS